LIKSEAGNSKRSTKPVRRGGNQITRTKLAYRQAGLSAGVDKFQMLNRNGKSEIRRKMQFQTRVPDGQVLDLKFQILQAAPHHSSIHPIISSYSLYLNADR
jgi:hypothetical protein